MNSLFSVWTELRRYIIIYFLIPPRKKCQQWEVRVICFPSRLGCVVYAIIPRLKFQNKKKTRPFCEQFILLLHSILFGWLGKMRFMEISIVSVPPERKAHSQSQCIHICWACTKVQGARRGTQYLFVAVIVVAIYIFFSPAVR